MRAAMRRAPLALVSIALSGTAFGVASAGAQEPASTPVPSTPVPPAPAPAPVTAQLSVALQRANGARVVVVAGDRFVVRGTVTPYVAGQQVVVRLYRDQHKLASKAVTVKPDATGANGMFVMGLSTRTAGRVTVRASHRATPQLATMVAKPVALDVLPVALRDGARGAPVRVVQRRLAALGYVTGEAGLFDARTQRAVLAFRKVTGLARNTTVDRTFAGRLAQGQGAFPVRYPSHGKHVEADLSLQVLALIRAGKVERIYPISSGAPVTPTVLGSFRVYLRTPGTNTKGMVYSSYFIRGYAIHGYASVPVFAASHGCLRVPVPDAVPIFEWLSYGDRVDVYP